MIYEKKEKIYQKKLINLIKKNCQCFFLICFEVRCCVEV